MQTKEARFECNPRISKSQELGSIGREEAISRTKYFHYLGRSILKLLLEVGYEFIVRLCTDNFFTIESRRVSSPVENSDFN